nr:MAG TPA: hypothetical protein [Caudoviricetes sp.]
MVSHSAVLTISGHIFVSFLFVLVIVYHIMFYMSRRITKSLQLMQFIQ